MSDLDIDEEPVRPQLIDSEIIYHEDLDPAHGRCVVYCRAPGRRKGLCPSCSTRAHIRDINGWDVDTVPGQFAYLLGKFLGGWTAAWRDATLGMVRRKAGE